MESTRGPRIYSENGVVRPEFEAVVPKKRKRRYSDGGVVLGFALILFLVYLAGYVITLANRDRVAQAVVIFGSIEPVMVFSGVIVRDEKVYYSNAHGMVMYHVQNFERVRAGSPGASVHDEAARSLHMETILDIEDSILAQQAGRNFSPSVENELRSLNNTLVRTIDSLSLAVSAADMQSLYTLTHRMEQLLGNRNRILLNEARNAMYEDLADGRRRMGEAISEIRVVNSGIISYKTDGYEYILTPARLRDLSREETLITVDFLNIHIPTVVSPGDPVFKLIRSHNWHIAAFLPLDQVIDWRVNGGVTIYADDGNGVFRPLEAIVYILNADAIAGEAYVVLKVNHRVADFLDRRSVSFRIHEELNEGFKIPRSAVAEKTLLRIPSECVVRRSGMDEVLRFNPETNDFDVVIISVFGSSDGYHNIIYEYNEINIGDILAVPDTRNERRVVAGSETIHGVYVTNTGMAVFRRVHLPAGFAEGTTNYIVVDPLLNSGLRVQDRIAADAGTVVLNQFIY